MEKLRNLSLKKTFILYVTLSLLVMFFLSAVINYYVTFAQQQIWSKYINEEIYYQARAGEGEDYVASIRRPSNGIMSDRDRFLSEMCDFLETYSALILSVGGCSIAAFLFYRNKLRAPIKELKEASWMIAKDDLDFHITYENKDELGQLCREFEKMRAQLAENNQKMWRMVEDEKALRAAVAHDIRSPLSVLLGYQEMLLEFVGDGTLDQEKTLEMLKEGMVQIERMDGFIETMRKTARLEERVPQFSPVRAGDLLEQIQKEGEVLGKKAGKICTVSGRQKEQVMWIDEEMVLEVVENLLANALRYAREKVEITAKPSEHELAVLVSDDGAGFQEDAETVTRAFFHGDSKDNLQHFGMGMYISRVYCERHGGRLIVGNKEDGGAFVKAIFKYGKE